MRSSHARWEAEEVLLTQSAREGARSFNAGQECRDSRKQGSGADSSRLENICASTDVIHSEQERERERRPERSSLCDLGKDLGRRRGRAETQRNERNNARQGREIQMQRSPRTEKKI